jgi:hypothetical protein
LNGKFAKSDLFPCFKIYNLIILGIKVYDDKVLRGT